jgi:hypothetical protein
MSTQDEFSLDIERFLDRLFEEDPLYISDVRTWVSFFHYLPKELANLGMGCDGYVFRQRNSDVTLTVKATEGGTPLVAFTTAATPTACMLVFLRALRGSRVRWIRDKYPWN